MGGGSVGLGEWGEACISISVSCVLSTEEVDEFTRL